MKTKDFSKISSSYSDKSVVQQSASDKVLDFLNIGKEASILDVGCGTGKITQKLSSFTNGEIIGVDPSKGMIEKAKEENSHSKINFYLLSAEDINFPGEFDIIFCNSAMQWFRDPEKVFINFNRALNNNGKVGIQAPAKTEYCPNFVKAVEKVKENEKTKDIFSGFKNPWFFYDTEKEYSDLLKSNGFSPEICKIEKIQTNHTPNEVFKIFNSGAAAGYLNQHYYDTEINEQYINDFNSIIKNEFENQADSDGLVSLIFHRIYILAHKSHNV